MNTNQHRGKRSRRAQESLKPSGDPGVGGVLADPLDTDSSRDDIDPVAGRPSADAPQPRQHQDWSPNKRPAIRREDRNA